MRAKSKLLALALAAALQPAVADVVRLDFEDFTGFVELGSRYSASAGLTFGSNAWGVRAFDQPNPCAGTIRFQPLSNGSPNCGALLLAEDAGGGFGADTLSFKISSDFGFVNSISFGFALGTDAGAKVDVLDANGNSLLPTLGDLGGDACSNGYFFCDWKTQILSFSGVAYSIVFSARDQGLMLDDLTLTTDLPPSTDLPEPASIALAVAALAAAGWTRRRAAR